MASGPSYLSRLSKSALNLFSQVRDPLSVGPVTLFEFGRPSSLKNWRVASDAVFGGCSSGELKLHSEAETCAAGSVEDGQRETLSERHPEGETASTYGSGGDSKDKEHGESSFMRFSGVYSRKIDPARAHPKLRKSGFVSITGRPLDSLDSYIDLESYKSLKYTIRIPERSLHRTFLANVRSDNWVTGGSQEDVWQAVLHDGKHIQDGFEGYDGWQTVEIPLDAFVLTWRGKVVAERTEMGKTKVTGLGIGLLGGDDHVEEHGDFCLDLRKIEAIP
jgi:hypothetical protein